MVDLVAAEIAAREHIGAAGPLPLLGWGISGAVFITHDRRTAVKIHHRKEQFDAEAKAYKKLASAQLYALHGLAIPKPRAYDAPRLAIQMDVVRPPYLLDFAGVLYRPPDFPADAMADWHRRIEFYYGPNAVMAYSVYDSLRKLGMYYMDFRPSNMKLDGLPGLIPMPPEDENEPY